MTVDAIWTRIRRAGVAVLAVAALFALAAPAAAQNPAHAAPRDQAGAYLAGLAERTLPLLAAMPAPQRADALRLALREHVDLPGIARFALGRHWRAADEAQRAEFVQLFEDLVVRTADAGLSSYAGQQLRLLDTRQTGDAEEIVVRGEFVPREGPAIALDFRMRPERDRFRIADIAVEGISIRIALRDLFADMMQEKGGTMPALLAAMRELIRLTLRDAR